MQEDDLASNESDPCPYRPNPPVLLDCGAAGGAREATGSSN